MKSKTLMLFHGMSKHFDMFLDMSKDEVPASQLPRLTGFARGDWECAEISLEISLAEVHLH